jgi:glycosyltransferase domain-containing protein
VTPKEVELLSELTIIIPTYNRPLELERSIEYWRDLSVTIHILDGSEKPWFPIGPIDRASTVTYHHMPVHENQTPMENFFQRITYGSKLSTTRFSALGCDDDFYTISGLVESLKILDSSHHIDAVAGRVLTFQKIENTDVLWWCKYLGWKDNESSRSGDFSIRAIQKKNWFLYAVCQTDLWQKYLLASYTPTSFTKTQFYAHEWLMMRFSTAMFRTIFLERFMTVRQVTVEGANKPPVLSWHDWLTLKEYSEQVQELRSQLQRGFLSVSSDQVLNELTASHLVNAEIEQVLKKNSKEVESRQSSSPIKQSMIRSVPDWLKNIYLLTLSTSSAVGMKRYRLRFLFLLLKRGGIDFDKREIVNIQKLLLMPREELRLRANI